MVNFDEEKRGYNKAQVEGYIKALGEEYQLLMDEVASNKEKDTSYTEVVAAAFINAEIFGEKIVAEAQLKAREIGCKAEQEVEQIRQNKRKILEGLKDVSDKILSIITEEEKC